jgi:hypothetical protein
MSQNYENHRRRFPMYHYIAAPIVYGYALYALWLAIAVPGLTEIVRAIFAFGVAVLALSARAMALRVQNRLIRLEMKLRLKEVLPGPLFARFGELSIRQLVALRFAGDGEIVNLVERTLRNEFPKPNDIKMAIKDWQPDYMRV